MLADFNFYRNEYKGIAIADETSYGYFAERASDVLALYSTRSVFREENAQLQLKKCACSIADILFYQNAQTKDGKTISSESVAGFYSATYQVKTQDDLRREIRSAIRTYLGAYLVGAKKVAW